jgi:hypothetical protein
LAVDAKELQTILEMPGARVVDACLASLTGDRRDRIGDFFLDAARDDLLLHVSDHGVKDEDGRSG